MSVQVFLQIAGLNRLIAPGQPDGKFTRGSEGPSAQPRNVRCRGKSEGAVRALIVAKKRLPLSPGFLLRKYNTYPGNFLKQIYAF